MDDGPVPGANGFRLRTPAEFAFTEALAYLTRSPVETLFRVHDGRVLRLVSLLSRPVLLQVACAESGWLDVTVTGDTSPAQYQAAAAYVREWFHLDCDLVQFYDLARSDDILAPLVAAYFGLRLIGVPDLFEALCWAVIGQQINLTFAYTLKRRFVQSCGVSETWDGETYWLFPAPDRVAQLDVATLQELQMTRRKSEYIIGIAQQMACGDLKKEKLLRQSPAEARKTLTAIRGVGEWTASYVAMCCLRDNAAFPVGDVGLQNAVKERLGTDRKPTPAELVDIGKRWAGWQAYATFYLWRSLQGPSAWWAVTDRSRDTGAGCR